MADTNDAMASDERRPARVGRAGPAIWAAAVAVLGLGACAGLTFTPPAVAGPVEVAAARRGFDVESVVRGREIYVRKCGDCHALVRPDEHTEAEWAEILPRMSRKARLGAGDAGDVRGYVLSARDAKQSGGVAERMVQGAAIEAALPRGSSAASDPASR
jgi:cytochrome c5